MLVFTFGADEDEIDKVADGLREASHRGVEVGAIGAQPSDALKLDDDESRMVTDTSDDSDTAAADADSAEKDDPAGKTKSRAHFLTIRDEDFDWLQPGEFLNDTLIDFWFQWCVPSVVVHTEFIHAPTLACLLVVRIWRKERHAHTDVHFYIAADLSTLTLHHSILSFVSAPYQDNSWDCGVFVCRYGFWIYSLRGHDVTYAHRNDDKFRSFITESEEFAFDRTEIMVAAAANVANLENCPALVGNGWDAGHHASFSSWYWTRNQHWNAGIEGVSIVITESSGDTE
jgi:hypothetical protein